MERMGWEGLAYYGVAGSTAATLLENIRDVSWGIDKTFGDTTRRGASTAPPKKTSRVTQSSADGFQLVMLNDNSDTALQAMLTAVNNDTAVAIRLKDFSAGKGFDGDVYMSFANPQPLTGEQTITFSCTPTRSAGREWQAYV